MSRALLDDEAINSGFQDPAQTLYRIKAAELLLLVESSEETP